MLIPKLILFFFFLYSPTIIGQSYQVNYEHVISFGTDMTVKELGEILLKKRKNNQQQLSTLTITNGTSVYRPVEIFEESQNSNDLNTTNIVYDPSIYKDQSNKKLALFYKNYEPDLYGKDVNIVEKLPIYNWEFLKQKDTIAGYPCKLAKTESIGGSQVVAWFTEEIPINDGPRELWGLPGLIVQAQINERVLIAAINIKKLEKEIIIDLPNDKNAITTKEFKQLVHDLFEPRTITTPDGRTITVGR